MNKPAAATAIFKPADWFALLDWREVFATPQPLEIELGCGKGAFLAWAAQTRPHHNFLGVERQLVRLRRVDKKAHRFGLANVRLLRVEANYFVTKLVPDHSVAGYHIYFPDPWPKRRHHDRRLINPVFVMELHRTLGPGGAVNVATDDADYFAAMQATFAQSGKFSATAPEALPAAAQTEFEKIFLAQGQPIWRSRYVAGDSQCH